MTTIPFLDVNFGVLGTRRVASYKLILDNQPKVLRLGADAVDDGAQVGSQAWLAKQNQELQRQLQEARVLLDTNRAELVRARAGTLPSLSGSVGDSKVLGAATPAT